MDVCCLFCRSVHRECLLVLDAGMNEEGDGLWDPQGVCKVCVCGRLQLVFCCNAREPEGLSLLGEKSGEGLWAGYLVFWHAWPVESLFSKHYRNYNDAFKTHCAAWNRAGAHIHWFIEHWFI